MTYSLLPVGGDLILPRPPASFIKSMPRSPNNPAAFARLRLIYILKLYALRSGGRNLLEVSLPGPHWLIWWCFTETTPTDEGLVYLDLYVLRYGLGFL